METFDTEQRRFDQLIKRHKTLIRFICMVRSKNNLTRFAELVEECYVDLWRVMPALRPDATPQQERSWVAWRCRSVVSHHYMLQRPSWVTLDDARLDALASDDSIDSIRETLDDLSVGLNERERLYLRLNSEGYSAGEIAQRMQLPTDRVYKMRQRIIAKMRDTYNRNYNK